MARRRFSLSLCRCSLKARSDRGLSSVPSSPFANKQAMSANAHRSVPFAASWSASLPWLRFVHRYLMLMSRGLCLVLCLVLCLCSVLLLSAEFATLRCRCHCPPAPSFARSPWSQHWPPSLMCLCHHLPRARAFAVCAPVVSSLIRSSQWARAEPRWAEEASPRRRCWCSCSC